MLEVLLLLMVVEARQLLQLCRRGLDVAGRNSRHGRSRRCTSTVIGVDHHVGACESGALELRESASTIVCIVGGHV